MDRSDKLNATSRHRIELHRRRTEPSSFPKFYGSGMSAAEVIMIAEFQPVLKKWVNWYNAVHPSPGFWQRNPNPGARWENFQGEPQTPDRTMGAIDYLAYWSGVSHRRISHFYNGHGVYVTLAIADKLLQAMERTDYLADGTLHVVPNPHWTQEHYVEYMKLRGC